jgi:hypothetical protein
MKICVLLTAMASPLIPNISLYALNLIRLPSDESQVDIVTLLYFLRGTARETVWKKTWEMDRAGSTNDMDDKFIQSFRWRT